MPRDVLNGKYQRQSHSNSSSEKALKYLKLEWRSGSFAGICARVCKEASITTTGCCHRSRESAAISLVLDALVGMTIRDCSVFTRYDNKGSEVGADVKLADLDMKRAKLER